MNTNTCGYNKPISDRYNNMARELPIQSCHCMEKEGFIGENMRHDIGLGLLDIYGKSTRIITPTGHFVPKTKHEFQYSGINKNPSYYLDMSETIGNRPVVRSHDLDNPPTYGGYHSIPNKTNNYSCIQPIWDPKCA